MASCVKGCCSSTAGLLNLMWQGETLRRFSQNSGCMEPLLPSEPADETFGGVIQRKVSLNSKETKAMAYLGVGLGSRTFHNLEPAGQVHVDLEAGRLCESDVWRKYIIDLVDMLRALPIRVIRFPIDCLSVEVLLFRNEPIDSLQDAQRFHVRRATERLVPAWLATTTLLVMIVRWLFGCADIFEGLFGSIHGNHDHLSLVEILLPPCAFVSLCWMDVIFKQRRDVMVYANLARRMLRQSTDQERMAKVRVHRKVLVALKERGKKQEKMLKRQLATDVHRILGTNRWNDWCGKEELKIDSTIDDKDDSTLERMGDAVLGSKDSSFEKVVEDVQNENARKSVLKRIQSLLEMCKRSIDTLKRIEQRVVQAESRATPRRQPCREFEGEELESSLPAQRSTLHRTSTMEAKQLLEGVPEEVTCDASDAAAAAAPDAAPAAEPARASATAPAACKKQKPPSTPPKDEEGLMTMPSGDDESEDRSSFSCSTSRPCVATPPTSQRGHRGGCEGSQALANHEPIQASANALAAATPPAAQRKKRQKPPTIPSSEKVLMTMPSGDDESENQSIKLFVAKPPTSEPRRRGGCEDSQVTSDASDAAAAAAADAGFAAAAAAAAEPASANATSPATCKGWSRVTTPPNQKGSATMPSGDDKSEIRSTRSSSPSRSSSRSIVETPPRSRGRSPQCGVSQAHQEPCSSRGPRGDPDDSDEKEPKPLSVDRLKKIWEAKVIRENIQAREGSQGARERSQEHHKHETPGAAHSGSERSQSPRVSFRDRKYGPKDKHPTAAGVPESPKRSTKAPTVQAWASPAPAGVYGVLPTGADTSSIPPTSAAHAITKDGVAAPAAATQQGHVDIESYRPSHTVLPIAHIAAPNKPGQGWSSSVLTPTPQGRHDIGAFPAQPSKCMTPPMSGKRLELEIWRGRNTLELDMDFNMFRILLCLAYPEHFKEDQDIMPYMNTAALFEESSSWNPWKLKLVQGARFDAACCVALAACPRLFFVVKYRSLHALWPYDQTMANIFIYASLISSVHFLWVVARKVGFASRDIMVSYESLVILQRFVRDFPNLENLSEYNDIIQNYAAKDDSAKDDQRQADLFTHDDPERSCLVNWTILDDGEAKETKDWAPLFYLALNDMNGIHLWWSMRKHIIFSFMSRQAYLELSTSAMFLAVVIMMALAVIDRFVFKQFHCSDVWVTGMLFYTGQMLWRAMDACIRINCCLSFDSTRLVQIKSRLISNVDETRHQLTLTTAAFIDSLVEAIDRKLDAVRIFGMVADAGLQKKVAMAVFGGFASGVLKLLSKTLLGHV